MTTAFLEEHGDEVMPSPETPPPPAHAVVLASVAVLLHEVSFFRSIVPLYELTHPAIGVSVSEYSSM